MPVQMITDRLHIYTLTHLPGRIEPPFLSSSGAVTEEISRCQCASSYAGQNHCRVTARHHTSERGRHSYLAWVFLPVENTEAKMIQMCVIVKQGDM